MKSEEFKEFKTGINKLLIDYVKQMRGLIDMKMDKKDY